MEEAAAGAVHRGRDANVTVEFPELRDLIITRLGERKGIKIRELDPSTNSDRPVHFYEMLTHERYRVLRRTKARHLRIPGFRHSFGEFFARVSSEGPQKRVYDVEDLRKLSK